MATINGYTAEKMKEIADSAFKAAAIVGDNLVITHQDDTTTVVGNVRGPEGDPGISDMALYDPIGVPKPLLIPTIPAGHGLCDGTTEYDASGCPVLAAAYGTGPSCVNGVAAVGKIKLPDMRGRTIFGLHPGITAFDTLLEAGGSKDAVIVSHDHNATSDQTGHDHTVDMPAHDHGGSTVGPDGGHFHLGSIANVLSSADTSHAHTGNTGYTSEGHTGGSLAGDVPVNIDTQGHHQHNISSYDPGPVTSSNVDPGISTTVHTANGGVSGTDKNLPPYRVGNWIMRLA